MVAKPEISALEKAEIVEEFKTLVADRSSRKLSEWAFGEALGKLPGSHCINMMQLLALIGDVKVDIPDWLDDEIIHGIPDCEEVDG